MNTRKLVSLFTALFGLAVSAFAQTQQTQATVAKVSGAATVTLPDGSTAPLTAGMKISQGATITTGADGDVYLESHAGYVTAIKKDSVVAVDEISVTTEGGKVKEEKTLLNLKSGDMVAILDPKKRAVNNYQVRTPKGVAAARGTVFTVQVRGTTFSIAVVNGTVTITPPSGVYSGGIEIPAGKAVLGIPGVDENDNRFLTTTELGKVGDNMFHLSDVLAEAVATVAVAAQNGIGGTTLAEFQQVATAVIKADPGAAAKIADLVQASAPTLVDAVKTIVNNVAPSQNNAVNNATNDATTPQPIDPSTVSRSNE